ncbi:MAG: YdcF family protein [Burkholderiaceae bacterium]
MNLASVVQDIKPLLMVALLPPVPLLVLVAMGAGLLRQHRWIGRGLLALGLLGLWLSCCQASGDWLGRHGVGATEALSPQQMAQLLQHSRQRSDVAVLVLGGGARSYLAEYAGPSLKRYSLERLRYGVWLARRIEAPLGFSGGIGWGAHHLDRAEAQIAAHTAAEEFRLPLRWAEGRSRDTRENAANSLALLQADGIRTLVLVTHSMHMPRSLRAFRQVAEGRMEIIAAPVDVIEDRPLDRSDWVPTSDGFDSVRYAVYEWLGMKAGH